MKIQIIQVGKDKDPATQAMVKEFTKRLNAFCKVEMVTLKSSGGSISVPHEKIVREDSLMISRYIPRDSFVVVLDEDGKEFTSKGFSAEIGKWKDQGLAVCFVIGGPFGLSDNIKGSANLKLSLSQMTFTHQMVRVFLLEQIYRGFCILTGKEYHT